MMSIGFSINECEKCIYIKSTPKQYILLCLYVDDMVIIGSNKEIIQKTKNMLSGKFDMKDMGLADVILEIKSLELLMELFCLKLIMRKQYLRDSKKYSSGVAKTSIDPSLHVTKNSCEAVSQLEYAHVIGSLMYLTNCTRSDLVHTVNVLSRYTSNPGHKH